MSAAAPQVDAPAAPVARPSLLAWFPKRSLFANVAIGLQVVVFTFYIVGAFAAWQYAESSVPGGTLTYSLGLQEYTLCQAGSCKTTSLAGLTLPSTVSVPVLTLGFAAELIGFISAFASFIVGIVGHRISAVGGPEKALFFSLILAAVTLAFGVIGLASGGTQTEALAKLINESSRGLFAFKWGAGFAVGLTGLLLSAISVGLFVFDRLSSKKATATTVPAATAP